jgi:hypothetical protein
MANYKYLWQPIDNVVTTIQLDKVTKDKLKKLKIHPRESYNKVIERLLAFRTDEGELSEQTIKEIEQSLEDIRAGRTLSMKQVKHID